jgi:tRNA nucleotidyltransferase/poly(A) polymerase
MPQIYKVGGCVRDRLLGLDSKDIDFTFVLDDLNQSVGEGFDEMTKYLQSEGYEIFLSTSEMFTIRAKFPVNHKFKGMVADFVMARKEVGYTEGTRRPILKLGNLEDDLVRRDFTLNAMAEDIDGNLIDLFDGQWALENRLLITPKDASITMLDDPLRLLRAFRFSITKGFTITPRIWETCLMDSVVDKLEQVVSGERIREEVFKMFKHNTIETLDLMREINNINPRIIEIMFGKGMWLKPTFEK